MNPGAGAGEVCTCEGAAGPWEAAAAGRGRPGPAELVVLGLGRSPGAEHRLQSGVDRSPRRAGCPGGVGSEWPPGAAERTCQARRSAEPSPRAVGTGAGGARLTLVGGHLETAQVGRPPFQGLVCVGEWAGSLLASVFGKGVGSTPVNVGRPSFAFRRLGLTRGTNVWRALSRAVQGSEGPRVSRYPRACERSPGSPPPPVSPAAPSKGPRAAVARNSACQAKPAPRQGRGGDAGAGWAVPRGNPAGLCALRCQLGALCLAFPRAPGS